MGREHWRSLGKQSLARLAVHTSCNYLVVVYHMFQIWVCTWQNRHQRGKATDGLCERWSGGDKETQEWWKGEYRNDRRDKMLFKRCDEWWPRAPVRSQQTGQHSRLNPLSWPYQKSNFYVTEDWIREASCV